ncbi:MAG: type III-B CRISPR module RAMP protein Cmr6 [Calditrichaeota bacterium]|nr:MAG: type III-B CRISPR module RAMP protein Cmr6 [Calditrichota bacterium]
MAHYTRPGRGEPHFNSDQIAPSLLYQKWQPWDDFNASGKFDRTNSRLDYLNAITSAVQTIFESERYTNWFDRYDKAMQSQGAVKYTKETVWRLIIGWGTNPTLESGLTLHHLYGFPYIPGSAAKGVVHHAAEMMVMGKLDFDNKIREKWQLKLKQVEKAIKELQLIRILFGSIHLERPRRDEENGETEYFGPQCPQSFLTTLKEEIDRHTETVSDEWHEVSKAIDALFKEHTGAILRFYDAVPTAPTSFDKAETLEDRLLHTDILNPHYSDYYKDPKNHVPSDDQKPIPVQFLAVKPQTEFNFYFYIQNLPNATAPRDREEKERVEILQSFTEDALQNKVEKWLQTALGECGVGAKTTAGYGYFDTGAFKVELTENQKEIVRPVIEEPIEPEEPAPFPNKKPAKMKEIKGGHDAGAWQAVSGIEWVTAINHLRGPVFATGDPQPPSCKITHEQGKELEIGYTVEKNQGGQVKLFMFYVTVRLAGVENKAQAQWIWEERIRPILNS